MTILLGVAGVERAYHKLFAALAQAKVLLAAAESCTGGLFAGACTSVAGSSTWFERGFVTYSNAAKVEMLGVLSSSLQQHGAVSEQVAGEMAQGAISNSQANWGIAVTGIAGPSGGSVAKPLGTVFIALADKDRVFVERHLFGGGRDAVRRQAVIAMFNLLAANWQ